MNVLEMIQKDHERIDNLLWEISQIEEVDFEERERLLLDLKEAIILHMICEEEVLYSKLKDVYHDGDIINLRYGEHSIIETYLEELSEIDICDKKWFRKFNGLKKYHRRHVNEEIRDIFPRVRKQIQEKELDRIGKSYRKNMQSLHAAA